MLFHPVQLIAIAAMFCPGLWVAPPRPPDTPPMSRRAVIGYKVFGGLALSQVVWFIPDGSRCQPDSLCDMLRAHDESLARSTLRLGQSPSSPAPFSRPYMSSLLKTTCPVVIIPPRPVPTCRNTAIHPTFEWAPQSLVPSFALAERSCSPSPIPIFLGDERTYVHPNISPFPLPRPTDAAPISPMLLVVAWLSRRKFLGHILAIVCAAILVLAKLVARHWRHSMETLCKVEGHGLFQAFKNISWLVSCSVIGRSYHFGDVNINFTLFASAVAGKLLYDMLTKGAISIITSQLRTSLYDFYENHALQVVSAGACRTSRIVRSLAIVVVYTIWVLLVAADFDIVGHNDVSGEMLKFVNVRVSWILASFKLKSFYAVWTLVVTALHDLTTAHALNLFPTCLRSTSPRPNDAFLPIPSLNVIDMSVNRNIARTMVAAIIPEGLVQVACLVMDEINAVATLFVDTDAQTLVVDGGEDDIIISAVPIIMASSSPPPTRAPLLAALLAEPEPIIASPILVIDEGISAEPSATLAVATSSIDEDQDLGLRSELVDGCEDDIITLTPPTAVEELHEPEPTPGMIPLPESPAIVPFVVIDDPVPAQLEDIAELEAEPQPAPESLAVAILAVVEIIPEDAPFPESEDALQQKPKPVLGLVLAVDEAFSVGVIKDVPEHESDPDPLLIATHSQLEDATEPEPPSMSVPVLMQEREPESNLSLVIHVDDPTPSDPLPFAVDPKPEGTPQSPPDLSPSTYCANCSTAGESPFEETKLPRIRRRIRRSIKRARKEAVENAGQSSSIGTRQVITSTTPTRSQPSPQRVQSPSNRSDPLRAQRDSDYTARARQTRQTPSESTPTASSSRARQNLEPRTQQYRPLQTRQSAPVASSSGVRNPEPRTRPQQSGQSPSEFVPVRVSSNMAQLTPRRLPHRVFGAGRNYL